MIVNWPIQVDEGPHVQVAQGDEEHEEAAISIQRRVHSKQHCEDQDYLHALREQEEPPRSHGHPAKIYQVPYESEDVEDSVEDHENACYNSEGEKCTGIGSAGIQGGIVLDIQEVDHINRHH